MSLLAERVPTMRRSDVCVEGVRFALHRSDPPDGSPTDRLPVLLLHGVPETASTWTPLAAELAPSRTVLAPDLKGLGASEVVGPYDVATLVRELAALVLHEVDGPVDVVGHDWGGSLAIALAGARPDLVRRLVVLNGPFRYLDLLHAAYIPVVDLPLLPEAAWALAGRSLVRAAYTRLWGRGGTASPGGSAGAVEPALLAEAQAAYADAARARAMFGYYRANTRRQLLPLLAATAAPGLLERRPPTRVRAERVLVVWGAADAALPVRVGEQATRDLGPETTMVTLPGVGHWPLEEAPEVVVPIIARFLAAPSRRPPSPPLPEEIDLVEAEPAGV